MKANGSPAQEVLFLAEHFEISERFRGPPRSGNGGYTCGRLARHLKGTVAVRLRAAPPLGAELRIEATDDEARLFQGQTLLAEARRSQIDFQPPPCPTYAEAEDSSRLFVGFKNHPFPGCFVCGPERIAGDGLRIFPGAVNGGPTVAAPWVPTASLTNDLGRVKSELLWSALDCVGAFVNPIPEGVAVVLGELCASIIGEVMSDEKCVVIGWPLGIEGRKRLAGSAVFALEGRLVAIARAVWIEVPRSSWA